MCPNTTVQTHWTHKHADPAAYHARPSVSDHLPKSNHHNVNRTRRERNSDTRREAGARPNRVHPNEQANARNEAVNIGFRILYSIMYAATSSNPSECGGLNTQSSVA